MKQELIYLRDSFKKTMVQNFLKDGYLVPLVFIYKFGKVKIIQIPNNVLASQSGKDNLAEMIKKECRMGAFAAGMIIEAYCTQIDIKANSRVKNDSLVMVFSTPEKEELFVYNVDIEKKKIIEELDSKGAQSVAGRFSDFFSWMKN